jgi:hypothetical protein
VDLFGRKAAAQVAKLEAELWVARGQVVRAEMLEKSCKDAEARLMQQLYDLGRDNAKLAAELAATKLLAEERLNRIERLENRSTLEAQHLTALHAELMAADAEAQRAGAQGPMTVGGFAERLAPRFGDDACEPPEGTVFFGRPKPPGYVEPEAAPDPETPTED